MFCLQFGTRSGTERLLRVRTWENGRACASLVASSPETGKRGVQLKRDDFTAEAHESVVSSSVLD